MRRVAALFGAAAVGGAAGLVTNKTPSPVVLASNVLSPHRPTTVLVHGLDSSKETWNGVLAQLATAGYPAIALDLRGHGESPLGDPKGFTAQQLAEDVIDAVRAHGVDDCVLIGHSMGGRVAMQAAAIDGAAGNRPLFRSVIIEDMDIRPRALASPPDDALPPSSAAELLRFTSSGGRRFVDWPSARDALLRWYNGDVARVESWKRSRVRPLPGGDWWSDLNPAAQRLARDKVLASEDGASSWDTLASLPVKVHLWYAGAEDTVCELKGKGGIEDMARRVPTAQLRHFAEAGHSIHNSARTEFMEALFEVVDSPR
mgnify:CR=1 FL=1